MPGPTPTIRSGSSGIRRLPRRSTRGVRIVTSPNVRLHTADRCPGERYNATKNCPEFREADTRRYDDKWPDARKGGDSFVNPNLDQASEYFQVQGSPLVNVESETSE